MVDAEQFWPNIIPWPKDVKVQDGDFWGGSHPNFYYFDGTNDAYHIEPGSWVIDKDGYRFALSNEVFNKRYESAEK